MQRSSSKILCCIYFLLHLAGLSIFLKGFFPVKSVSTGYSTLNDSCFGLDSQCCKSEEPVSDCYLKPAFGRLAVVVVDALRADFVLPKRICQAEDDGCSASEADDHREGRAGRIVDRMSYVSSLICQNETIAFTGKAIPPTVTLPRIKAIVTGAVPGFVDVILNFDSSSLLEDNIITQLFNHGKSLVFYGDDTWLKLLPGHFIRSDGTTSFFVADYTEVDNNVTRHLDDELKRNDWDVMILHYLGLDHIGHLSGPSSPLISPKLEEMDGVIKMLLQKFTEQDKGRTLPTLLLLCGDHGMSDQGSHGGSTSSEIFTPIVFLSSQFRNGHGVHYMKQVVHQIDIAPTLSLLLGTPIPKNSFGVVSADALHHYDMEKKLMAAFINAQQLMKVAGKNFADLQQGGVLAQLQMVIESHKRWISLNKNSTSTASLGKKILTKYIQAMRSVQDMFISSSSCYDLHAMSFGILLLSLVFLTVLIQFLDSRCEFGLENYKKLSLGVTCAMATLVHLSLCTSTECSPFLCSGLVFLITSLVLVTAVFLFMSMLLSTTVFDKTLQTAKKRKYFTKVSYSDVVQTVGLWPGVLLHAISLLSSSFVEEEHQTWYFITVTVFLIFSGYFAILHFCGPALNYGDSKSHADCVMTSTLKPDDFDGKKVETVEECCTFKSGNSVSSSHLNSSVQKCKKESSDMKVSSSSLQSLLLCGVCAILCRAARAWNQTGDKWSHLPDIGDWLVRPDNKVILSLISYLSLVVVCIFTLPRTRDLWIRFAFICGVFGICFFHLAHGAILLPYFYSGTITQGVTEARAVYTFVFVIVCKTSLNLIQSSWKGKGSERNSAENYISHKSGRRNEDLHITNSDPFKQAEVSETELMATDDFVGTNWTNVHIAWTLMMLLLVRVHNLLLVAIVIMQNACLHLVIKPLSRILTSSSIVILYLWMGHASFFYQGNSNSLASVDVAAGYTGLDDYQPFFIGLQMCVATYAGPVFWLLSLLETIPGLRMEESDHRKKQQNYHVTRVFFTILINRLVVLILYLMIATVQRYHLFVWTVFSPKLLYEGVYSLVISSLVISTLAVSIIV